MAAASAGATGHALLRVAFASSLTAVAAGLGAIPFILDHYLNPISSHIRAGDGPDNAAKPGASGSVPSAAEIGAAGSAVRSRGLLRYSTAIAAGMMLACSVILLIEGYEIGFESPAALHAPHARAHGTGATSLSSWTSLAWALAPLLVGAAAGIGMVVASQRFLTAMGHGHSHGHSAHGHGHSHSPSHSSGLGHRHGQASGRTQRQPRRGASIAAGANADADGDESDVSDLSLDSGEPLLVTPHPPADLVSVSSQQHGHGDNVNDDDAGDDDHADDDAGSLVAQLRARLSADGASRRAALLILVMAAHSFAEGVSMGVSWAKSAHLGSFVSTSLALHNVPEGLAVAAVVVRSGAGPWAAAAWAIASSLPQPVAAVPAFLCVSLFEALTPAGLAFAAGAMLWVPISDLLPEACAELPPLRVAVVATVTAAAMFLVSHWLEG